MCRAILLALSTTAVVCTVPSAPAHDRGFPYPRVRTFSGGFYGPTQAHYQYQRRYGRPWHGGGGFYYGGGAGRFNGYRGYRGYGAVLGGWAYPPLTAYGYVPPYASGFYDFGATVVSPVVVPPVVVPPVFGGGSVAPGGGWGLPSVGGYLGTTSPTPPAWVQPPQPINPVLSDAWDQNLQQWEQPLELLPVIPSGKPTLPPSTPAARIRSVQLQQHGDRRLRDLDYLQAVRRYRDAISAAADRAEPHLHLAIAFAGMKQFENAAKELKVGLALDPAWPVSGVSLESLLGAANLIGKMHLKQRVAQWALVDVRDPDRLFLLGALMCLDDDTERGRYILETAARLGGMQEYLAVFLRAGSPGGATAEAEISSVLMPPELAQPDLAEADIVPALPELPPLPTLPATVAPPASGDLPSGSGDQPSGAASQAPEITGPAFPE